MTVPQAARAPQTSPTWRSIRRGRIPAALVVGFVLLAGCGGTADPEPADSNAGEAEEVEPDAAVDDDAVSDDEVVPADDAGDVDDPGNGVASSPNEHRPPAEALALADCDAVTESSPGAVIVFPSDANPAWLEAGPSPVTVEFLGCSDTFEANLQYEAFLDGATTPATAGITMGGTLGDWGEFSFEETFQAPGTWTVEVFDNDAESGARVVYDEVTFTVDP